MVNGECVVGDKSSELDSECNNNLNSLEVMEKYLGQYLEIEKLLNQLFKNINFCVPYCINQQDSLYEVVGTKGCHGCCNEDMHLDRYHDPPINAMDLLTKKRIEKYGQVSSELENMCGYHSSNGCVLKNHKPYICVAYACKSMKKYMCGMGIDYNDGRVINFLKKLLCHEVGDEDYNFTKGQLENLVKFTSR